MRLLFATEKLEKQCRKVSEATRLFGGDMQLAVKLLGRINALEQAEVLRDIVVQRQFRFHKLFDKGRRKYEGCFAIDVKSKADPWRLVIQPLDEDEKPFEPCNIDEVSGVVRIVEIVEVSKHYD